jgi:helix-turn-helix protein
MADPRVYSEAKLVGICIMNHVNARNGQAWVSDETVADKICMSIRAVVRARKLLRQTGWLSWKRTKNANVYTPQFDKIEIVLDALTDKRDQRQERREKRRAKTAAHIPRVSHHRPSDTPQVSHQDTPQASYPDTPPVAHIHLRDNTLEGTPYRLPESEEEIVEGRGESPLTAATRDEKNIRQHVCGQRRFDQDPASS